MRNVLAARDIDPADDGHCYLPAPNLITGAAKILDVPAELVAPCLDELATADGVVREAVPAATPTARAEAAGDGTRMPGLATHQPGQHSGWRRTGWSASLSKKLQMN